ncbi:MAG: hypothetical protein JWM82_501 [Myxococcales bacterium]|nr:hypothetical protein [Myxococcales bacterium]
MKISEIGNGYAHLWNRFREESKKEKLTAKSTKGFLTTTVGTAGHVNVHGVFHLPEWPYKASSTTKGKRVDILIGGYDTYDSKGDVLSSSNIQLKYFKRESENKTAQSILEMHYDFDAAQLPAHPIFHAQLGPTKFDQKDLDDLGVSREIKAPLDPMYGSLRIPTPHMGFAAILLALASHHWTLGGFQAFLKEMREAQIVHWKTSCSGLRKSLESRPSYMHSHHWY